VVGGSSKMLKYFMNQYFPNRIISYADKDWSIGNLYRSMGFVEVSDGYPDYKYVVDNIRVHKSKYRKSKLSTDLSESNYMKNNGVYKIWDCGKLKFEIILGGLT